MTEQARGIASQVLIDLEDTYGTTRAAADRRPVKLTINPPYNVGPETALNQAATIRGNQNPDLPFDGFPNVSGNFTVPVDFRQSGMIFKLAVGTPSTLESVWPGDRKTGSPTVTITSGTAVFSVAQTSAAVGDRVVYTTSAGVRGECFIQSENDPPGDETSWEVATTRAGGAAPGDTTAATVNAIVQNKGAATIGTIAITAGAAVFSLAQANLAVGQMIIYDIIGIRKMAFVTVVTDTTHATVIDGLGIAAPTCTAKAIESIESCSYWLHTFTVGAVTAVSSFTAEKGFTNITTPAYYRGPGCKLNTLDLGFGGDDEMTLAVSVIGKGTESAETTALDAGDSPDAANIYSRSARFNPTDTFTVTEGGVSFGTLRNFSLSIGRNLDTDSRVLGADGGVLRNLTEGQVTLGGRISAVYEDDTVVAKSLAGTESSVKVRCTSKAETSNYVEVELPEIRYRRDSPDITGPGGVLTEYEIVGYYHNSTTTVVTESGSTTVPTALVVRLQNQQALYA